MSAEPNIKTHRYYEKQRHIKLPRNLVSKSLFSAEAIALIDAGNVVPITGTPPVLATLFVGDLLSARVTWGSYTGAGVITTTRQMQLNAGAWVAYVGSTVMVLGQNWRVRELVSDTVIVDQEFRSAVRVVEATLDQQMRTLVDTKPGIAFDPGVAATVFSDNAGTVPAVQAGPVGRILGSLLPTPTPPMSALSQNTAAAAPTLDGKALTFDGVDDFLANPGDPTLSFQNITGFFLCARVVLTAPLTGGIISFGSGGTVSAIRQQIRALGTGDGTVQFNTDDGLGTQAFSSVPGKLVAGAPVTLTLAVDYDAAVAKGYVNGVQVAAIPLRNVSSPITIPCNRMRVMNLHGNTVAVQGGKVQRFAHFYSKLSASEQAAVEAWVAVQ